MPSIAFDNSYARLPETFYASVQPDRVPDPQLIEVNEALATSLGLDVEWLRSPEGLAMLSGNAPPANADPLAQAYAGHQFGGWVPQLGDGRAILLGEVVSPEGERFDIQLKGSGRTPYSRGGDGKSALGPVLREYLLSEAMAALGVPTTRALAAVSSGEFVRRETMLPGAILTRVARSHIRVGTFQFFYARNDTASLQLLADHAMARHYPGAVSAEHPCLAFLQGVIEAQAKLVAHWMPLGFIHGVMNTDNMTVSGETIDYGPCAFMDDFHWEKVFSSIDRHGRYAWGNQPAAAHWDLTRLAESLLPILSSDAIEARSMAEEALEAFAKHFDNQYTRRMRAKLGLGTHEETESEASFLATTLHLLAEEEVDFTLFFRRLTQVAAGAGGGEKSLSDLFNQPEALPSWLSEWREVTRGTDDERVARLEGMRAVNPIRIPRNHRVEACIQDGLQGDFSAFHRLMEALRDPFVENEDFADYEKAPRPAEVVCQTFCGT